MKNKTLLLNGFFYTMALSKAFPREQSKVIVLLTVHFSSRVKTHKAFKIICNRSFKFSRISPDSNQDSVQRGRVVKAPD